MLWKIILSWDPNIPQHTWFPPCELNLCIFVCLSASDCFPSLCNLPHKHYMEAQCWQPPVLNHFYFFFLVWPNTVQDLAVYILKRGWGRRWWWWCLMVGGGAGYGAKWKHVTQGPLKRNPAQQKKGTQIIIKSSRGKVKTANIIPSPPPHTHHRHTQHTHTHTVWHSSPSFPSDDREDGMIGATVCLPTAWEWQEDVFLELPDHGTFWKFSEQTWSNSYQ